jgi:RNA polymerase sigma-70 factor, ECF subfamily
MAVEGDQAALESLFGQYRPRLYQTALRLCGSPEDAEDALQDGLFSAFRHLARFQGRSQFSTWLTRIVINATLMRMRQGKRLMMSIDQVRGNEWDLVNALRDAAPNPEVTYAKKELLDKFCRRLQSLPPAYQDVLWLRLVQGFSTEEAANALGLPQGTLKSLLHRGRAKFARVANPGKGALKTIVPLLGRRRRPAGKARKWTNDTARKTLLETRLCPRP